MANRRSGAARYPVDLELDANDAIAGLQRLEDLVRSKVLRSAAFAGANVLYREMRIRVPVKEGTLYNAIYQFHDDTSTPDRQTYFVGPNKRKAPHWYFIEFGHWLYNKQIDGRWQRSKPNRAARGPGAHTLPGARKEPLWVPPKPFVRPTWEAMRKQTITAMKLRASERLREVMAGGS